MWNKPNTNELNDGENVQNAPLLPSRSELKISGGAKEEVVKLNPFDSSEVASFVYAPASSNLKARQTKAKRFEGKSGRAVEEVEAEAEGS